MDNIVDIINENDYDEEKVLNETDKMSRGRLKVCKKCPLYKESAAGPICNPALWISEEDKETSSSTERVGYRRGCGCNLLRKTKLSISKCIVGKW